MSEAHARRLTRGAAGRIARIPRSGIRDTLEHADGDMLDLAAGDPSFPTPAHIVEAAARAAREGKTHYTHGRGTLELREVFAAKLAHENAIHGVDAAREIVVTAGALNALSSTIQALVDPGDEVIIPDPGFANYAAQVLLAGGTPIPLHHRERSGFLPDPDELAAMLTPRTRAVVLNSPANPTGAVIPRMLLEGIAAVLARTEALLIYDEAYERLIYPPALHTSAAAIPELRDRTISIFSLSKTYAMTGWRIGFVVAPPAIATAVSTIQEHVIGCPSSVSQAAGVAALVGPDDGMREMQAEYARRRDIVLRAIESTSTLQCTPPDGAFYAFPSLTSVANQEPAVLLAKYAGVLVVPGTAFGDQGRSRFRISYAGETQRVIEGMRRIASALSSADESR